jgi:hypothetical protein
MACKLYVVFKTQVNSVLIHAQPSAAVCEHCTWSLTQSVCLLGREISPSQGRYLHRGQHKQNKRTETSMPQVGFEPTIPVFERAKIIHALDRAATVLGFLYTSIYSSRDSSKSVARGRWWTAGIRFPAGARNFSLVPNRDVKLSTHLHLILRLRMVELYLHSHIRIHGVMLN